MKKKNYILTSLAVFTLIFTLATGISTPKQSIFSSAVSVSPVLDTRDSVTLPILMYHGITEDNNSVTDYFITTDMLNEDLIWLKENGYTTVSPMQLISYVESGAHLPGKPVLLSFDDGYTNNYTLALPILESHGAKAVFSVIGSMADENSKSLSHSANSNMSWGEIALLAKSPSAYIGNHTFSLHSLKGENGRKGADMLKGESIENYHKTLAEDLEKNNALIEIASGYTPIVFAWPYGAYPADRNADEVLKDLGFKISLTSYQTTNTIEKGNLDSLLGLRRFLRTPGFSLSANLP